jgi:hypothetical protein
MYYICSDDVSTCDSSTNTVNYPHPISLCYSDVTHLTLMDVTQHVENMLYLPEIVIGHMFLLKFLETYFLEDGPHNILDRSGVLVMIEEQMTYILKSLLLQDVKHYTT